MVHVIWGIIFLNIDDKTNLSSMEKRSRCWSGLKIEADENGIQSSFLWMNTLTTNYSSKKTILGTKCGLNIELVLTVKPNFIENCCFRLKLGSLDIELVFKHEIVLLAEFAPVQTCTSFGI